MSDLRDESIELLLELEEKLTELLRATAPDDHQRSNRLAYLIKRARHIRTGWGTRWARLDAVLVIHELQEGQGRRAPD